MYTNVMPITSKGAFEPDMVGLAFQDESSNTTHVFQLRVHEAKRLVELMQKVIEHLGDK